MARFGDLMTLVDQQLVVDLAQGMARIPTPLGEEKPLAQFVAQELHRLGFEVELQRVVGDRDPYFFGPPLWPSFEN